ncbi:hypothetical protein QJS04_geneDACA004868 [Acorus gramineus]|uniref:Uncharacterized protein n=1 Tax=Acorus gramineus TaxID=55184 RepID=A0AAV9BTE2_ACOGR|nr:hypothetical protein QJS04_geneDACA004868 [Acorus gramineus]
MLIHWTRFNPENNGFCPSFMPISLLSHGIACFKASSISHSSSAKPFKVTIDKKP